MIKFECLIEFLNGFSKFYCYKAYTLAEVLIVIAIIGIIALLIIPSVIQKTQNQEHVVGLKKLLI